MTKTQVEKESRVITGAHGVAAEEDHLVLGKVIFVGVASIVIFVIGGYASYRLQVRTEQEAQPNGPPATPAPILAGQYEIGIVNQRLFDMDLHAQEKIGAQRLELEKGRGGKAGEVRFMPIEQAMQQVIAQSKTQVPTPPVPSPELSPGSQLTPAPQSPRNRL